MAQGEQRVPGGLDAGTCDPRWAQTITECAKYFGINGTRARPWYVTPVEAGDKVITIKRGAKIGLIGDWGTGAEPARRVLEELKQTEPDILVHLGDIYYSGTEMECQEKFETVVEEVFDRRRTKLPVYTLSGNHDMYSGGVGYHSLIQRLNTGFTDVKAASMVQPASFFCLRSEDENWQLLAMDTGRNDYSPFSVTDVVTFLKAPNRIGSSNDSRNSPARLSCCHTTSCSRRFRKSGGALRMASYLRSIRNCSILMKR